MPMNPDLVAEYGTPEWWLRYLLRKPELRPAVDRMPCLLSTSDPADEQPL